MHLGTGPDSDFPSYRSTYAAEEWAELLYAVIQPEWPALPDIFASEPSKKVCVGCGSDINEPWLRALLKQIMKSIQIIDEETHKLFIPFKRLFFLHLFQSGHSRFSDIIKTSSFQVTDQQTYHTPWVCVHVHLLHCGHTSSKCVFFSSPKQFFFSIVSLLCCYLWDQSPPKRDQGRTKCSRVGRTAVKLQINTSHKPNSQ